MRILTGAAQSASSLRRRLRQRGFEDETILQTVRRCRALGYVDDARLAESVARRHARHGHGTARVIADLQQRGVARDLIAAATAEMGSDEEAAVMPVATALVERARRRGEMDDAAWRRVAGALQRRGFSARSIRAALRSLS